MLLNATQRCDRCGAQAYHRAVKGDFELLFCNHHFQKHKVKLNDELWFIESDVEFAEAPTAPALTE